MTPDEWIKFRNECRWVGFNTNKDGSIGCQLSELAPWSRMDKALGAKSLAQTILTVGTGYGESMEAAFAAALVDAQEREQKRTQSAASLENQP